MADTLGRQTSHLYLSGKSDRVNQFAFVSLLDGKNNAFIGLNSGSSLPGTNNTFLGSYSGANATYVDGSVFMGMASGRRARRIKESVFLGYKTGELSDRVESSVSIGAYAGRKMQRANCNTLIGFQSGAELTSGSRNTILGSYAGFSQFNAHDNVCVGHRAGYKNTIGSNNCYVGTNSGFAAYNAYENVAIGVKSGEGLTSGTKNVLAGYAAGANISSASNCIAIGTQAMEFFSDGDTNTCIGTRAARHFTGINNTILGGYSTGNAIGNYNTIVGSRCMNRPSQNGRSGEAVGLSNCVILGENIQFDIPIRYISVYPPEFDIVPIEQIGLPTSQTANSITFGPSSNAYVSLNFVPVGDPMLIRERSIEFGTVTHPVIFDTSSSTTYAVSWGSMVSETNTLLAPIPIHTIITSRPSGITVNLDAYGQGIDTFVFAPSGTLNVYLKQIFDPPTISYTFSTSTQTQTSNVTNIPLPGLDVQVQRLVSSTLTTLTLYVTANTQYLVPGMEIQITKSSVEGIDGIWRIRSIGIPEDGATPVIIDIPFDFPGVDLGPNAKVLLSRTVSAYVLGRCVDDVITVQVPKFAGMLFGELTTPQVYIDGSGDIPEGVYDVTLVDAFTGEFSISASLPDGEDVYLGVVTLGTFEPLIVGFSIDTLYNLSNAPYPGDGHIQSGIGSQEQMDANISQHVLEFAGNGAYEYAEYTLPRESSKNITVSGTFDMPKTNDIILGMEWLDQYDIRFSKTGTSLSATIFSGGQEFVDFSSSTVEFIGSVSATDFPIDMTDILQTSHPRITCTLIHDIITRILIVTFTIQGGVRIDPIENTFLPQGRAHSASFTFPDIPALLVPTSTSVKYYSNGVTKLGDVMLESTPTTAPDPVTINDVSITFSQRSDTGVQTNEFVGPSAFDGHIHRGAGTQDSMDVDIRSNVLTFTDIGYSAAEYKVGSLSNKIEAAVTFEDLKDSTFGIEWMESLQLTCTLANDQLGVELKYTPESRALLTLNETIFGRMITSIRAFDDNIPIEAEYPLSLTWLNGTPSVYMSIKHNIKSKTLDMVVRMQGGTRRVDVIAQIASLQDISINRFSGIVRYFASAALTATGIDMTNENYQSYPSFSDCIFIGSNFTVGGNVETIDKERGNVCIAAIGTTRLFRGRLDEFRFFSNVVTIPMLSLEGDASGNASLHISSVTGNALSVLGNSGFTGDVVIDGHSNIQTLTVTGPTILQNTLTVTDAATFQNTLHVDDSVTFGSTFTVTGAATLQSTLDVTDTVTLRDTLDVIGDVSCANVLDVSKAVTFGNTLDVSGDVNFSKTLDVTGATTLSNTLDVTSNVDIGGSLDVIRTITVGGAADFNSSLDVAGTLTVGGMTDLNSTLSVANLASFDGGITTTTVDASGLVSGGTIASDSSVSGLTLDIDNSANIGTISAGATSVDSLSVTNDALVSGTLTVNEDVTIQGTAVKASIDGLNTDVDTLQTAVDTKVSKSGDTMSGDLTVNGTMSATQVVTTDSTTSSSNDVAVITGTGRISRSNQNWALQSQLSGKVSKSGDSMSGSLSVTGSISSTTSIFAQNTIFAGRTSDPGTGASLYCQGTCVVTNNLNVTEDINGKRLFITGTKNFSIPHPLLSNAQLMHACIESPRSDLMYRGTTQLVNGNAMVNIDTECTRDPKGMQPGTFEAMTTNPMVFVQCIDSFERVRGFVDSGTLHIVCENPESCARVHWMIVAERYDTFMTATYPDGIFPPEQFT